MLDTVTKWKCNGRPKAVEIYMFIHCYGLSCFRKVLVLKLVNNNNNRTVIIEGLYSIKGNV